MDDKQRCQSCGMPLGTGFYGTNEDGTENTTYCKFCYQNGDFVEPLMTLQDMIHRSIQQMMTSEHMPSEQAHKLAHDVIPNLGRWKK